MPQSEFTPVNSGYTDVDGIAKLLSKSTSTIYKWKAARFIPFHQTAAGAPVMFDVEVVKAWWAGLHTQGKSKLA